MNRFKPNSKHGLARRTATMLVQHHREHPGAWLDFSEIGKRVLQLQRRCHPDRIRREVYACRPILKQQHGLELLIRGGRARVIVDGFDVFKNQYLEATRRLRKAAQQVEEARRSALSLGFQEPDRARFLRYFEAATEVLQKRLLPAVGDLLDSEAAPA